MIMKLFPGQETCPHCKTVYRYADLKKLVFWRIWNSLKKPRVSKRLKTE